MAPGAPRGKRKPVRGKGKSFSRNLRPLDDEDTSIVPVDSGSEDENESGSEGSDSDGAPGPSTSTDATAEMSREERRAAAKARKEAAKARNAGPVQSDEESEGETAAPAIKKLEKGVGGIRISNPNDPRNATGEPSRREKEAMAAAAAKERYWKLQQEGKTDQAKADLARLAQIRKEREEKALMRKAELEEKKRVAEEKANERLGKGKAPSKRR
ncbi:hypothetical protein EX30DRAFT_364756 [Ascodesmis nigricans]|uniref:Casein kinase substrate phosphoprotein PP28 domain-containing protein n=1 Tax=Ascodesmis nigricans TaxID=341454 RepID=A0A4S2MUR7_9PEZI|nr:hypothetical protein EX30DRAFT_364756 [Ascodesmis nigricans]